MRRVSDAAVARSALIAAIALLSTVLAVGFQQVVQAKDCTGTSEGLTPLNDLGGGSYEGEPGGLYPGDTNQRPNESAARSAADGIGPLDAQGNADPDGRYGLVSIGMSNTKLEFNRFFWLSWDDPDRDQQLTVVNGAQGGVDAEMWADPDGKWWNEAENRVTGRGLTPEQVQVAWVKLAIGNPTAAGWAETERLQGYLADVARILKDRFPNIQIAYYSSRIYAGYADKGLSPEPYAYQGAFAIKWLIENQIDGDPALNFDLSEGPGKAPLITWGPYLWADGIDPRSDELTWECSDFADDGTHPSDLGTEKVAHSLLDYFKADSTAQRWYMETGDTECTIQGTEGDDVMYGTEGDDVICGLEGGDKIYGLGGDDTLLGEDGNDLLLPGRGFDTVEGGAGTETVSYQDFSGAVTVDLAAGTASEGSTRDSLAGIENVIGGKYEDTISGDSGSNTLSGGGGNDHIYGLGGNDTLSGGGGDDYLAGGDGTDQCRGGTGTNTIVNCER